MLRNFSWAAGAAWTLSQRQTAVQTSAIPASETQMRKESAKNVADHENETQHRDREKNVDQQFAANKAIDQFHFSMDRLAQVFRVAHASRTLMSVRLGFSAPSPRRASLFTKFCFRMNFANMLP